MCVQLYILCVCTYTYIRILYKVSSAHDWQYDAWVFTYSTFLKGQSVGDLVTYCASFLLCVYSTVVMQSVTYK